MNELLTQLSAEVPYLAVFSGFGYWTIRAFLRSLADRDEKYAQALDRIAARSDKAINRNTHALDRNTQAFGEVTQALKN